MTIAINYSDSHSGIAGLLWGVSPKFDIYGDAPIEVEHPITYQRAQNIIHVDDRWFYLPRLNELWQVDMWTEGLQAALDARNARAGAPEAWTRPIDQYPAFMPHHKADYVFGVAW